MLKEVTDSLAAVINQKQEDIERRNIIQLDSLHEQLSRLSALLLPSPSAADVTNSRNQHPNLNPLRGSEICVGKLLVRALL